MSSFPYYLLLFLIIMIIVIAPCSFQLVIMLQVPIKPARFFPKKKTNIKKVMVVESWKSLQAIAWQFLSKSDINC